MCLILRADSSTDIGIGHITRCLALAQAWLEHGGRAVFVSHCESGMLRQRIQNAGIELIPLDHLHDGRDDFKLVRPILDAIRLKGSESRVWVVLDGYHFDAAYQSAVRGAGLSLMVIDDMNHLPFYDANVLLNQNIHAKTLAYNCNTDTVLLLGLDYLLLRPEFVRPMQPKHEVKRDGCRVLVTMGGADPDNATLKVVQALNLLDVPGLEVAIVLGPANPHKESLEKDLQLSSHFECRLLHSVDDMANLMEWADIAVSAGGSTCWELCAMSLPFLTVVLSENQRQIAEGLSAAGITVNLGNLELLSVENIVSELSRVIGNNSQRLEMARLGSSLVDRFGSKRVVEALLRSQ